MTAAGRVAVTGELDLPVVPKWEAAIPNLVPGELLVVYRRDLTFIDSLGIHVPMVSALERMACRFARGRPAERQVVPSHAAEGEH